MKMLMILSGTNSRIDNTCIISNWHPAPQNKVVLVFKSRTYIITVIYATKKEA